MKRLALNSLGRVLTINTAVIGCIFSVSAIAAPVVDIRPSTTTSVTKTIVKSTATPSASKGAALIPDKSLKATSKTNTEYGVVYSYIDTTSVANANGIVTNDKDGDYRVGVSVTVYTEGLPLDDKVKVFSTVEQNYVSCGTGMQYQNKLLASDVKGVTVYKWASSKTSLTKADFESVPAKSINGLNLSAICDYKPLQAIKK